ncbi:transposase [uncultured Methanobrevibacter sp.]|uniref:transposase n=1 Tax=uncultured Methanobrevibacter sp. TaxID=253161 RepID=UPI002619B0B3
MVKNNNYENQSKLGIVTLDSAVPKNHIARYVVKFIDECYDFLQIPKKNKKSKKGGRPAFSQKEMFKLLIYAKIEHIESAKYIADMARYHDIYKYVCNDIKPSERSIQRFRRENGKNFEALLKMTLKKASDAGFTEFNHVAIDGTIKKAHNSNNNVITKKETQILIDYFNGMPTSSETLEKLHKPAQRILEYEKLSDDDKLELLYDISTQFTLTGQNTIPVNDIEARFMKSKKGNQMVAYNIQSAVDYDTKLICAINVSQRPTDHYELPEIAEKAINNIGKVPQTMSADTIYLNEISLSFFANNNINGLIPTRKQSKERIGRLNENPYHKDHFAYLFEQDAFLCPEGQMLTFFNDYVEKNDDPNKPDKIKRLYSNYGACKACKAKNKCISDSQYHRTITEYGSEMKKGMQLKMENDANKEEYSKRSSVEGPFGVFKEQFQIEKEVVIGVRKTEERINLDAVAYNLIRLYNLENEKENSEKDLIDFCEKESVKNELQLKVTVF